MTIFGYKFKNESLLEQALTHSSYGNEQHCAYNERLEFLGDSVLGIIVSDYLFLNMPDVDEGVLSKLRASVVCEHSLASLAKKIDIGERVRLGKGEEATGGRERASILSDAFEAVIAAIYLDSNMDTAKKWVISLMEPILKLAEQGKTYRDYKTTLQEEIQKTSGKVTYETIESTGPDHNKGFKVEVLVNGKRAATASGISKKDAEQNAAKKVLKDLGYEIL